MQCETKERCFKINNIDFTKEIERRLFIKKLFVSLFMFEVLV